MCGALKGRYGRWTLSLGPAFCLAACLCAGVATLVVCTWSTVRQMERAAKAHRTAQTLASSSLPSVARRGERSRASPAQQAAAGNLVVARTLAQSLSRAASDGDARAVDDLAGGLARFGASARVAVQEELGRARDPRARDALLRVLERIDS